jgi:cytoskeletal protein CcmA (bactofilin family)
MADKETVIGLETRISGEIRGDEDLVVRGRVDGKIHLSQTLTVDKGAIVQADVDVRTLVVAGTLVGDIVASESVRLAPTARVVGSLASPRVMMEAGAAYRGRVDMGDIEGARAAVASRAAVGKPSSVSSTSTARSTLSTGSSEVRTRPAPPRLATPPKTAAVPAKAPPRPPTTERQTGPAGPSAPPAFPRVAGAASSAAPAWAKKKIHRR